MKRKIIAFLLTSAMVMSAGITGALSNEERSTVALTASAAYDSSTTESYALKVFELVNRERAANGLSALKMSDTLCNAANVRAQEIQTVFSHTRPNGTTCFTAITEAGAKYSYAAENIAYGQRTPEEVMNGWMNSSGHRANILSKNAEYIGIGVKYKNGTYYWTQFFAKGSNMGGSTVTTAAPAQTTKPATTTKKAAATTKATTTKKAAAPKVTTTKKSAAPKVTTTKKAAVTTTAPACNENSCKVCTPIGCFDISSLLKNACGSGGCGNTASGMICKILSNCQ